MRKHKRVVLIHRIHFSLLALPSPCTFDFRKKEKNLSLAERRKSFYYNMETVERVKTNIDRLVEAQKKAAEEKLVLALQARPCTAPRAHLASLNRKGSAPGGSAACSNLSNVF